MEPKYGTAEDDARMELWSRLDDMVARLDSLEVMVAALRVREGADSGLVGREGGRSRPRRGRWE